jgi:hypothetical protein
VLRKGIALMRDDYRRDPAQRTDFLIRALRAKRNYTPW